MDVKKIIPLNEGGPLLFSRVQ